MLPRALTLVICFVLQAIARPHATQAPFRITDGEDDCPTGIHIIGVRGTLEKEEFGAMKPLVDKLLEDIPNSDSIAIDYPAGGIEIVNGEPVYQPLKYIASVQRGRSQLSTELVDFNLYCPDTSVVLLSYSQGAQVSGDVLCGSTLPFFPHWSALEYEYKANIKAFITLGDPRNNHSTPVHAGNSTGNGIFIRTNFEDCGADTISSWKTYCDTNDTFCDDGNDINAHLHYVDDYFDDIIGFIKGKLAKASRSVFRGYGEKKHCGL